MIAKKNKNHAIEVSSIIGGYAAVMRTKNTIVPNSVQVVKKCRIDIKNALTIVFLIDTKDMNRILGKPLKTRGSGTLGVAGIESKRLRYA